MAEVGRPNLPRRRRRNRAVVVGGTIALAVSGVIVTQLVRVASRNPDTINLGARVFQVGRADRLAVRIAEAGPFLFKDPVSAQPGRELYVQHLGAAEDEGWLALLAYAPDSPRELRCLLTWDGSRMRFDNPCGPGSYPADGEGLLRYAAEVDDRGLVLVDLKKEPAR